MRCSHNSTVLCFYLVAGILAPRVISVSMLKVCFGVISGMCCTAFFHLRPVKKRFLMPATGSVLTADPIRREAAVCVERGLRQVNNP